MAVIALLAYRARNPGEAEKGLGAGVSHYLDELGGPKWREWPNGYLLWGPEEGKEMVKPSAVKFVRLHHPDIILALGVQTAFALGVPWQHFEWLAAYRLVIEEPVVIITVPYPSNSNHMMSDPDLRQKVSALFENIENPVWISQLTGRAST